MLENVASNDSFSVCVRLTQTENISINLLRATLVRKKWSCALFNMIILVTLKHSHVVKVASNVIFSSLREADTNRKIRINPLRTMVGSYK